MRVERTKGREKLIFQDRTLRLFCTDVPFTVPAKVWRWREMIGKLDISFFNPPTVPR
jgi:hypothetical protein